MYACPFCALDGLITLCPCMMLIHMVGFCIKFSLFKLVHFSSFTPILWIFFYKGRLLRYLIDPLHYIWQGKARVDMTVEERIEAADRRKRDGNELFKDDKFEEAMQQYEMVWNFT